MRQLLLLSLIDTLQSVDGLTKYARTHWSGQPQFGHQFARPVFFFFEQSRPIGLKYSHEIKGLLPNHMRF
jgi:hypothetical protein